MNFEEIKKLTNVELGKQLSELAGGNILADQFAEFGNGDDYFIYELQKFCTDLNAIAKIEAIVIETVGVINYDGWLKARVTQWAVIATARQRAEACLLALQES